MKKRLWLPYFIILVGLVIVGMGIWQLTNTNIQTEKTFSKAKKLVESNSNRTPQKTTIKKDTPPLKGDVIGLLDIPRIKAELAIVEGTNPNDLAKGVGHYKGSYFPGDHGQIVLSGHRDTVFRHLGELNIGDTLVVKLPKGNFSYKITHTKIVKAEDTSIITLQHKQEELILTTCYPFRYIGNAPDRYIIYAKPILKVKI
ncbi:MAG: class D sortase [Bacillota bacterium]|nr:class D sortase [Bacillota bacterium]